MTLMLWRLGEATRRRSWFSSLAPRRSEETPKLPPVDPPRPRVRSSDVLTFVRAALGHEDDSNSRGRGLNAYRAFAGADDHDLTLADVDLDIGRAWLAEFVERGRKPATVAARARALRVFSHWIVTEDYVRSDPLASLKVPTIPRTIVETFSTDQMSDLLAGASVPLAITLRIFLDTGVRLNEVTGLRISDVGDGQLRILGKGDDERAVPYGRALDAALRRYLTRERPDNLTQPGDPLLLGRDGLPRPPRRHRPPPP